MKGLIPLLMAVALVLAPSAARAQVPACNDPLDLSITDLPPAIPIGEVQTIGFSADTLGDYSYDDTVIHVELRNARGVLKASDVDGTLEELDFTPTDALPITVTATYIEEQLDTGAECQGTVTATTTPFLRPLPTLTTTAARRYVRRAIHERLARGWTVTRVAGCHRRSRVRIRCNPVDGFAGDASIHGRVTIWYSRAHGSVVWKYAYRLRLTDEYCKFVLHHTHCTKTLRVR